jgi:hypothetical protein
MITIFLVTSLSSATADPPLAPVEIQDRIVIEGCRLSSEKPHISEHVPGTVNVTGRTICKGISAGRYLRVTVTLTRIDGGNSAPVTKSATGSEAVTVNVAMPCIWTRNQSIINYTVVTVHKMSNGKSVTTRNKAAIKC